MYISDTVISALLVHFLHNDVFFGKRGSSNNLLQGILSMDCRCVGTLSMLLHCVPDLIKNTNLL